MNQKIKLPISLGLVVARILEDEHGIKRRYDKTGGLDLSYTKEELALITSLKLVNPVKGALLGVDLLPNIQSIEVKSNGITAHLQSKNICSLDDKDVEAISKCTTLTNLSLVNQAKVHSLDVSKLEKLQYLIITHNQNLEGIYGLENLQQLYDLECFGNNRLFDIDSIDKVVLNNELSELNLDVLLFPATIGYKSTTGEYNPQILEKLKEVNQIKWSESLVGNRSIKINHKQMIELHNKACEVLEESVDRRSSEPRDIIVGIERYLCRNVKYDDWGRDNNHTNGTTSIVNGKKVVIQNGPKYGTNSAYNALLFGTCVCEGYTRAMQYLLKLNGINSHNVDCYGEKDVTHMADSEFENRYSMFKMPDSAEYHSIICIDDFYNLYDDPCWNACYYQAGNQSMPWTLRTKEEISQDHTLSFDERAVSNNHLRQPANAIEASIRRNILFRNRRNSSINNTHAIIKKDIKGQIIEKEGKEI